MVGVRRHRRGAARLAVLVAFQRRQTLLAAPRCFRVRVAHGQAFRGG